MQDSFFDTTIEYLKGVGPQRAEVLKKEIKTYTFRDLLHHYPFRYIDKTHFTSIREAKGIGGVVQLKVKLADFSEKGAQRKKRLVATVMDNSGELELVWFKGIKWVKPTLRTGGVYVVYGKITQFGGKYNIAHPEIQEEEKRTMGAIMQPVYHSTEKLTSKGLHTKGIEKIIAGLLPQIKGRIHENLPDAVRSNYTLIDREEAFMRIHQPKGEDDLAKAIFRLKFEELLMVQMELLMTKELTQRKYKGHVFEEVGDVFTKFYQENLPFELTGAQKRVVKEVRRDLKAGVQMNRLLQGDVGSGKTLVALLSMFIALGNGFQAALMAPTEILSQQHFNTLVELCDGLGIRIELLTGSTKKARRKELHAALLNGQIDILIGTHALLEDIVQFKNLGLVVIDEQHRFGVAQRARLWKKHDMPPHILVMTATPIPRTLAMTLYGDLDVSIIDELPPGRKPVQTNHRFFNERVYYVYLSPQ